MLGSHWIADALDCRPDRLTADSIRRALVDLPDRLGLLRVGEPQVVEHGADGAQSIAGIVLIAESHVSFHAFPGARVLHADVFSCRSLDYGVATRFIVDHFAAASVTDRVLSRGRPEDDHCVRRLR